MPGSSAVKGFRDLDQKLRQMEPTVARKYLAKAVRKGLKPIRDEARRLAPVRTGRLRRAILAVIRRRGSRDAVRGHVGPSRDAGYGRFQELGTSRQAAQPFLRPALDTQAEAAIAAMREELAKGLAQGFK